MSTRTRRRLIFCVVVAALTLPADFILIKAMTTGEVQSASSWAQALSDRQVDLAARQIQDYPFAYRKEILRRLPSNEARAQVWIDHITSYRDSHPELSSEQVDALNAAIEVTRLTFAAMDGDGRENARAATRIVAERVTELFGPDVADYLMHRLGNRQTLMLVNAAPLHLRLTDWVRAKFVVQAESAGDCWCSLDWGCDVMSMTWCDGSSNCTVDDSWPACGWLLNDACDGVCKVGVQT
ncbi:MAG: bacteriocin fulvocin C-related protein [Vicinamibacterales bacterium]